MTERKFNNIIAVDDSNKVVGYMDLFDAIAAGHSRRVSKVFIFSASGKLLLQKRADWVIDPGTLDVSAAGHVEEDSDYLETAQKELYEELGLKLKLKEVACAVPTEGLFSTIYKATVPDDLVIPYNPEEVAAIVWKTIDEIEKEITEQPATYSDDFKVFWACYRDKILAA